MNDSTDLSRRAQPVILVLDDEEIITTALSAHFQLETDYVIECYQSPHDALARLCKGPVDLVITDFLMPEMDGLEFLSEVQKLFPQMPSILLTGYADKESAIKAINQVSLFQYVEKPWDNRHLLLVVRNALQNKILRDVLEDKVRELDMLLLERDKLMAHNEMLHEELQLAKNVQQSLLPTSLPSVGRFSIHAEYLPALEIGGDFYDVVPLAGSSFAVMIADVTGHGIQAALITSLLKSAILSFKDSECTPGEILRKINGLVYKVLPANLYVAALVAVIDSVSGQCRLANAGVPHPFAVRACSGDVERIAANGLLLGITDDVQFKPGEEISLTLARGDKLLFFTDGISEVENKDGERFDGHIMAALTEVNTRSCVSILHHLTQSAKKFSCTKHKWDDVTVLGMETKA